MEIYFSPFTNSLIINTKSEIETQKHPDLYQLNNDYDLSLPLNIYGANNSLNGFVAGWFPNGQHDPAAIRIAQEALSSGGSHQVVLNVANDQVVAKFLNKEISFVDIPKIIENCIDKHHAITEPTFNEIKEISLWTKEYLKKEFI